jgi:NADH-quinone oxidoreductase subunit J
VVLVIAALRVITARNPIHAALYLVLSFFSAASIWMLLRAEFLAIALVLVYVGAVMVLFLFVVMMLDINLDKLREGFWNYFPFAAVVGVVIVLEMALVLVHSFLRPDSTVPVLGVNSSNTRDLGILIFTNYVFAFEVAAAILLLAIVAAVVLTLRKRKDTKGQNPHQQIRVRRADRVRIVAMAAEKKE